MDYRSDRLSTHLDNFRLSSSLPGQRWPHLNSSHSSMVDTVGPSRQASSYRYDPTPDESLRAYRTTALRQLNGNPKPLSWKSRQEANHSGGGRSSTLSQPVLVRSYSGTDDTAETSKMPSRRSFPFTIRSGTQSRGPELPSEEDFSIDGILRAIDPHIRNTLDSIGEICGRSKLSLANEYGSHIAPLGEIRAPPGGLLTVEEASSDRERQADDGVVIYDDDNSVADVRDHTSFSHYGYLENLRQQPAITSNSVVYQSFRPFSYVERSSDQAQPDTPRSLIAADPNLDSDPAPGPLPTTREVASKPNPGGRTLLGKNAESATNDQIKNILTCALVSEILLDAQANGNSLNSMSQPLLSATHPDKGSDTTPDKPSVLADMQALFSWPKVASTDGQPQSAENRLRAMLERQSELTSTSNAD